jgi:hypothetical protein
MGGQANCVTCGWHTEGKNAMGNAAKHFNKLGHYVQVELYYGHFFGSDERVNLIADSDSVK